MMIKRTICFAGSSLVTVEKIWGCWTFAYSRFDALNGYKVLREIESSENFKRQIHQAVRLQEDQLNPEKVISHLQPIFYLMLFGNADHEISDVLQCSLRDLKEN